MRRTVEPELLDTDSGTPQEVAASLADLRGINRLFGGIGTMRDLVRDVARRTGARELTWLDVATGSGDVPAGVAAELAREGVTIRPVGLDRAATHLHSPDGPRPPSAGYGFPRVVGNALALPFRDGSVDLVGCSLFLHHLEPDEIRRFVAEALRVCRVAVVLNDLRRSVIHLGLVYLGTPLARSRITRHDGPASLHRAYTMREMHELLSASGAARVEMRRHFLYRMGAIVWK
jgi:ubiquinone/menaquinone biosynthesis C-methylase UbiE